MASFTVTKHKNTRLGADTATSEEKVKSASQVGGVILGTITSWHEKNVAKAYAEAAENDKKAAAYFTGTEPMGSGNKNWAAWRIIGKEGGSYQNWRALEHFTPALIAQAWAYIHSGTRTKDPSDPDVLKRMETVVFPQQPYSGAKNTFASFIEGHPEYYTQKLVNMATAYLQSGGKTIDLSSLTQPTVAVPSGAGTTRVPAAPSGTAEYGGMKTASMFPAGMQWLALTAIGGTIAYKLFLEKKPVRRRKR